MDPGDSGDFDGCECFFSHEFAMRRLLSLLRNSQTYCTDNECVDLQSNVSNSGSDNFTWMMCMMIGAVILYVMRPNSLRRRQNEPLNKPSPEDNNSNNQPPPPIQ
jgi:hypothetical protein